MMLEAIVQGMETTIWTVVAAIACTRGYEQTGAAQA
jgi:hypothetical protein